MRPRIVIHSPLDPMRIELNEDHELCYWTHRMMCTSTQLLDAIEAVGVDADAVSSYLSWRYEGGRGWTTAGTVQRTDSHCDVARSAAAAGN